MFIIKSLLIFVFYYCRVGSKEGGTRFLNFVDSTLGYRHLLQQSDLDRALSLCTGMKGKLKSRFIVLSDERVLPPPPPREVRGKRKQPSDDAQDGRKRNRSRVRTPLPGSVQTTSVQSSNQASSAIPPSSVNAVPLLNKPGNLTASGQFFTQGASVLPSTSDPLSIQGAASYPPSSSQGYFTAPAIQQNLIPRVVSLLQRPFSVPPPIMEVDAASNQSSLSTEDWASANSDETVIQ